MNITICKLNSLTTESNDIIPFLQKHNPHSQECGRNVYPSNNKKLLSKINDITIIKDNNIISGFYKITKLVSQYSKNNFTIYFDCNYINLINTIVNNINNDINNLINNIQGKNKCKIEIITKQKFMNYFNNFDLYIVNKDNVLLCKYF